MFSKNENLEPIQKPFLGRPRLMRNSPSIGAPRVNGFGLPLRSRYSRLGAMAA
jgi:hypothetical protein